MNKSCTIDDIMENTCQEISATPVDILHIITYLEHHIQLCMDAGGKLFHHLSQDAVPQGLRYVLTYNICSQLEHKYWFYCSNIGPLVKGSLCSICT
jgi:hypothetical protein